VAGDKMVVYNYDDASVLGYLDATAGTGRIYGMTNGVEYTIKIKATSDMVTYSDQNAWTGNAVATPTNRTRAAMVGGHMARRT